MVHAQLCQMPCFLILGCVVAALVSVSPVEAQLRLPSLLGDNAVLQRLVRVPIWGYGPPGATVRVTLAGQSCSAVVGADGTWRVRLDPMQAGGPYDMVVSAAAPTLPSPGTGEGRVGATSDQVVSRNVMVGDVWVASGQSNMVWPLNQSRNGDAETRAASFPQIRLFALLREPAAAPLMDCRGKWASCSPETAGGFSGVAYFFGRDLHARLGVPIGLIQSDVGGTPAESWTDPAWLRDDPDFAELLTKTPPAGAAAPLGQAAYEKTMNDWYVGAMMKDAGNRGFAQGWAGPSPPGEWGTMNLPGAWEANEPRLDIDGAVWYRHTVTIPRGWVGKGLTLSLGTIADRDVTYFGGVEVGASGGQYPDASVRRTYTVPARLVVEGPVVIAVRVFNMIAAGGFTGEPSDMRLHLTTDPASALSLAGPWRFRIEADRSAASVPPMPPPPADVWTAWSTGGLYNGMVAPLTRHAIRGVIWYQGESNVGRPDQYHKLFPTLIRGWRKAWGQGDFPFLFVQLANFNPRRSEPSESDWAELREAQLAALGMRKTAMAVAIDVGEAADIHPKNKRDVGLRLALAARSVAYNERGVAHSGPVFRSMSRAGGSLILRFAHTDGGLQAAGGVPLRGFAVAGKDRRFHWADAAIRRGAVVVTSPKVPDPVAVRYAWADNPDCNLVNGAGLPAVPFRTDRWSRIPVAQVHGTDPSDRDEGAAR